MEIIPRRNLCNEILIHQIMMDSSSEKITKHDSTSIIFPFSINIDPMEKLLLVNFEKDSDSIYTAFEPQVFNNHINGSGHLVIGWRKDKKIDVYHDDALTLDPSKYNIAGAGLNQMISCDMKNCTYEVDKFGVQAQYKFKDLSGRTVKIEIRERNPRKRKSFGLLAPMGDAASHPTSLPLVLLHDFYFVRKSQTDISVLIDKRLHKVDDLPIPIDFQKMTFTRYSPKPLIATLNPEYNGILETLDLKIGQQSFDKEDITYELEWNKNSPFVKSMIVKNAVYPLSMSFEPSFPSLNMNKVSQKGKFRISGHESVGSISGEYVIHSDNTSLAIQLTPTKGWKPKTTKFSTWFLFNMAKVFKKWPSTYQWDAKIQNKPKGEWTMQSKWTRTGKILKD